MGVILVIKCQSFEMECGTEPTPAQALRCPLTQGADGTLRAIQMGKEHKCPLVENPDGSYTCAISGLVHQCGKHCNKVIEGSEGLVCFLTGRCLGSQLVLHQPFNREGKTQSHYVTRPKSCGKRRSSSGVDIACNKSKLLIHKALQQILLSTKREQLQLFYHDRFLTETVKAARKQNACLLNISKTIKSVTQNHIMHLLPPAENQRIVDDLSETPIHF